MLTVRNRRIEPAGSHRITWERCPRCGRRAAVGWRIAATTDCAEPAAEHAVEFDCVSGCDLSFDELVLSFPSSGTGRTGAFRRPDRPDESARDAGAESAPGAYRSGGVPAGSSVVEATRPQRVNTVELIPGHPETRAEVWLWYGGIPEVSDDPRLWVSLQSDDWPMSPGTARRLAAALLTAAARAEA
jgi:hypothetical protein